MESVYIILLIIAVDLGLLLIWKILQSYWNHKEMMAIYNIEPEHFLNKTEEISKMINRKC